MYGNGSAYIGQFKNNKKHGKGCFTFKNGAMYDGK